MAWGISFCQASLQVVPRSLVILGFNIKSFNDVFQFHASPSLFGCGRWHLWIHADGLGLQLGWIGTGAEIG
jgi:hypothetical protein